MRRIAFWTSLIILGCNPSADNPRHYKVSNDQKNAFENPLPNGGYLLSYKNDSISQSMKVIFVNAKKITFELETDNIKLNRFSVLNGVATRDDPDGDPEEDVGEDGIAFLYDDWHYVNGKCQINFRIAAQAEYIRILQFDCGKLQDDKCPLETGHVLKRTDLRY